MRTLATLLLLAAPAFADIVHLRNGGKIEGRVSDKDGKVVVETANGTVSVNREDVERIEKKEFTPPKPVAPPPKAGPKLGAPYAHPFLAFKILLPPGWRRGENHGKARASFWGVKDQAYQPRMDLFIEADRRDLAEFVAKYKDGFKRAFPDVRFAFEDAASVRGRSAYQFSTVFTDGGIPQQSIWTFVTDGERKFVLSFNCTQAWFDRYHALVDASMRSLRLFPVPSATPEEQQKFIQAYSRGETAYRAGKLAEALADFKEAAKLYPGFADLHSTIGTIHQRQGRYPDAEQAYRKAIELDPDESAHPYNLGVCLLKQSKYDAAIATLRKAAELDPAYEPALTNLGVAYLGRDLNDPAREALEKAVAANPESAPAHYNLGLAYERLDRKKDAEREYKEALSADPAHAEAKKALDRLRSKK